MIYTYRGRKVGVATSVYLSPLFFGFVFINDFKNLCHSHLRAGARPRRSMPGPCHTTRPLLASNMPHGHTTRAVPYHKATSSEQHATRPLLASNMRPIVHNDHMWITRGSHGDHMGITWERIEVTLMIKFMIKAMIESFARITTVHGKHSGEFRRVACTLLVSLSKPQRAEEHPRAFETASRRCTKRTEGQKDRRTEGPIDKRSRCTTRTGGRKDGRTEGQKDRSTNGQTDNQRNGHTENNPRNGQPENRTNGPTTRAMPRGAELPCPKSRRPPSHCPAAVHELSREPAKVRVA